MKKQLPDLKVEFSKNGLFKLVSFGVALIVWATILSERKDGILVRDMEIDYVLRSNQRIVNPVEQQVQVKVSGPKAALRRLAQMPNVVTINLYQEPPGSREVEISSRMLELPGNVRLLSVRPNRIKVDIVEQRLVRPEEAADEP